jgi:hypothetical protein
MVASVKAAKVEDIHFPQTSHDVTIFVTCLIKSGKKTLEKLWKSVFIVLRKKIRNWAPINCSKYS